MKATLASILTLLLLTLAGCSGTENKVNLDLATSQNAAIDQDGDGIPDALEMDLCDRKTSRDVIGYSKLGTCTNGNWTPPGDLDQSAFVPTDVILGADADKDALPADVTLKGFIVKVDVFTSSRVTIERAEDWKISNVDTDDKDASQPAPSVVKVPEALPMTVKFTADKDGDNLPATVKVKFVYLTVDRRSGEALVSFAEGQEFENFVDTDDNDRNTPATSEVTVTYIPRDAWHTGDGDDDGLPGQLVLDWTTVTIDRTLDAADRISIGEARDRHTIDNDDEDRSSRVPFSMVDADADLIPDETEPIICAVQRERDPVDGRCVRSDGSGEDGSGNNYVPPINGKIALDLLDRTQGSQKHMASVGSTDDVGQDAPGVASITLLASLAALAGLVRRRL